jgi:hypothetical protein
MCSAGSSRTGSLGAASSSGGTARPTSSSQDAVPAAGRTVMCGGQVQVEGHKRAHRAGLVARRTLCALGGLLTFVVLCGAPPAWGQEYELKTLGTWGGSVNAVQVEGNLAYVAAGRRLVILDISDSSNPTEIGSIDLENVVQDLAVRAGYAYVCTLARPNYFCIVDVSDATNPRLVWRGDSDPEYSAQRVALYANAAYVQHDWGGIDMFDVSDPRTPVYVGAVEDHFTWSRDMIVAGDLLYIVDDPALLRIFDLAADPFDPVERGSVTPGNHTPSAIAVRGDYAYVTTKLSNGVLAIVDISDPEAPFVVGRYNDFHNARDVAVSNGLAYVADQGPNQMSFDWDLAKGLAIFDVATEPSNPRLVGTYNTRGSVWGVEIFGTTAYVFDEGEGLILLDLSDPVNPVRLGNYHSPAELRRMDKVGNLLYVTDYYNGVSILDVADPLRPALIGVYQTAQDGLNHWDIKVRDGLAYLAAGYAHLQVVDVTDPVNPVLVGTGQFVLEYYSIGLELYGNTASLGYGFDPGSDFRFVNFDITDPHDIVPVGDTYVGSHVFTIDTTPAGIAFAARSSNGGGTLTTLDTSDVTDPFAIYDGQPGGVDLARDENLLYLANRSSDEGIGGLYIVDVSDPVNPVQQGYWQIPLGGNKALYGVALSGQRAFVVPNQNVLYALDVSDPTTPRLLAEAYVSYSTDHVFADGAYAYVTGDRSGANAGNGGLVIFELSMSGDLNGDGCVGHADLGILLADWNCTEGDCPGDADGDGDTDHADLGILLANWGEGC